MFARNPIMLTGAALAALLALGSMMTAQEATDDSQVDNEISESDAGFDEFDDPIWPIKRGMFIGKSRCTIIFL